jgi:hypothetical protein
MRLSGLCLATLFLLSSWVLAQHSNSSSGSASSGGGGSHSSSGGSSSSGSSGGGSHSSSSSSSSPGGRSSSSSSAGHGSNGSSTAHGNNARVSSSGSASAVSPARGLRSTESIARSAIREPNGTLHAPVAHPEKRGFFSFLRHPFHKPAPKPESKPVADLRHRICFTGPCRLCPPGAQGGPCRAGTVVLHRSRPTCSGSAVWTGNPCVLGTHYLDDCSGLRSMMERQAQRMQAAESIRQSACAAGLSSECSEATTSWQSEQNLNSSLQQRYHQCRMQLGRTLPLRSFDMPSGSGRFFDSPRFDSR